MINRRKKLINITIFAILITMLCFLGVNGNGEEIEKPMKNQGPYETYVEEIAESEESIILPIHFQDLRAADDDYIHAAIAGTGGEQEITTGITNPDVTRNASVKTTNVNSPNGNVRLTGVTDKGESTYEDITIVAGSTVYGDVAWATLSKITVPAGVTSDDTVTIGMSDKLGLGLSIESVGDVFKKKVNNEDKSSEISGNVDTTYGTLNCATIVKNEDTTIWFRGRL